MNAPTFDSPQQHIDTAKRELSKLPLLGPALWLYARDQHRRFTFLADIDWRLMPPLMLDQCRLYHKLELPWSFVTWAFVNAAVDERLRSSSPTIAPGEWKSGDIPWLIDVVTPFGGAEEAATQVIAGIAPGKTVRAWIMSPQGQPQLKEFRPHA